jgi:menaquinone-dependent protoporphyrinogen IX oxidase
MGGITTKMKRIIDIDKLQEARQRQKKQKSNYWQRIKNDPVKFGHYKEWRKQYVNKKKEALTPPSPVVTVPIQSRENIISQITDLMCRVDWHDHELRNVWTALENLRSLLPAAGKGAGAA